MNGFINNQEYDDFISTKFCGDNQKDNSLELNSSCGSSSIKETQNFQCLSLQSQTKCKCEEKSSCTCTNHSNDKRDSHCLNFSDHASITSSNECTLSNHSSFTDKISNVQNEPSSPSQIAQVSLFPQSQNTKRDEKNKSEDNFDDIQLNTDDNSVNVIPQNNESTEIQVSTGTSDNINNGIVFQVVNANNDNGAISSFSSLSSLVSTGTELSLFTSSVGGEDASVNNFTTDIDEGALVSGTNTHLQLNSTKRFPTHNHSFHLPPNSETSSQGDSKEEIVEVPVKRNLSKISTLFSRKSKSSLTGSNSSLNSNHVISTTGLILQDRPEGLPLKNAEEMRKHEEEYKKIIESVKKRDLERKKSKHVATERQLEAEDRVHRLLQIWRKEVLTNWSNATTSSKVRKLWWEGVPSAVRSQVWKLAIGNDLRIDKHLYDHCLQKMRTRMQQQKCSQTQAAETNRLSGESVVKEPVIGADTIYDVASCNTDVVIRERRHSSYSGDRRLNRESSINIIKLDVSRTFPSLGLFQEGGPYYDSLHNLLGAYVCYRPDIGYIQGMSFIAAVLILTMNSVEDAFICFANILNKPCHHAFYSLDELLCGVYFKVFDKLFTYNLPRLHSHFLDYGIDANLYLFDWIFTLFSRTLPLETSFRVWDLFCRDGEEALFRSALGLLKVYEEKLLSENFDGMAEFLTGTMPDTLKPNDLVTHIRSISMETEEFLNFHDLLIAEQNKAMTELNGCISASGQPD